ncbi:MAG: pectate lyase [Phycisphaerales bacterium]
MRTSIGLGRVCRAHLLLLAVMVCMAHPTAQGRMGPVGLTGPILSMQGPAAIPAFPGAEGFGAYAKGGRGGRVIHVTTLADSGPGSLREAVEASGPRIVVFDVSGTIKLAKSLYVEEPFITIAGQTAPGDGICLRDATFGVGTDHVVIRYLRCRLGDEGREGDAISIGAGRHIIVDHCSASWSTDEVLSSSTGEPRLSDLTVQWCFITEALNPKNHGFGSLVRGCHGARYSYHHNLYAHNRGRNPRPGNYDDRNPHDKDPNGLLLDFRNNVIYNWGGGHAGYNADKESVTHLNYVGNYLVPGLDSSHDAKAYQEGSTYDRGYFAGNWYAHNQPQDPWSLVTFDGWNDRQISLYKQRVPFETGPIATQDAPAVYQAVLQSGGASLPDRDAVDRRIVEDVVKGTGRIIKSQNEVGGWPDLRSEAAPRDTDADGMPDAWEQQHNLNPNDAADGPQDRNNDGYTNIEDYLNGLVNL